MRKSLFHNTNRFKVTKESNQKYNRPNYIDGNEMVIVQVLKSHKHEILVWLKVRGVTKIQI